MVVQSHQKMPLYTKEGKTLLVCFNEREIETEQGVSYQYEGARVKFPCSYDELVSGIIRSRYNSDQMEALINNYLSAPENEYYQLEFIEMQNYRQEAKNVALQVLS